MKLIAKLINLIFYILEFLASLIGVLFILNVYGIFPIGINILDCLNILAFSVAIEFIYVAWLSFKLWIINLGKK